MNVNRARGVLIVVPILVLLMLLFASVFVYLFLKGDYIAERVRSSIVEQSLSMYGVKIEIEEAELMGASAILLKNVSLDMQPDSVILNGIKTITAPEAVVHFNVLDLLNGSNNGFDTVRSISFTNPHIVYRMDIAGISDVDIANSNVVVDMVDYSFAPEPVRLVSGASESDVVADDATAEIEDTDGQSLKTTNQWRDVVFSEGYTMKIHFMDGTAEWLANTTEGLARVELFENVNGTIIAAANMPLDVELEVTPVGFRDGSLQLFGFVPVFEEGASDVQIYFQNLGINYLQKKGLNLSQYIWCTEGFADGFLNMHGSYEQSFNTRGSVVLRDGVGTFDLFDGVFKKINGELDFSTRSTNIKELNAELDGIPVTVKGRISNFQDPYFDLTVVSETRSLKYLKPLVQSLNGEFPIQGEGQITSRIEGPQENIKITGNGDVRNGSVFGYEVDELFVDYIFRNWSTEFPSIVGKAYGGSLVGSAVIDMANDTLNYMVTLDGNNMEALDITKAFGLDSFISPCTGKVSSKVMIRTDASGIPVVTGSASIQNGSVKGYDFETVELGFWKADESIKLDYLVLEDGDSKFHTRGIIDGTNLDFDITAEGIGIDKFLKATGFDTVQLQGVTDFVGELVGTTAKPEIRGTVRIIDGTLLEWSFNEIVGQISFTGDQLHIQDASVFKNSMVHKVSGTVGLAESASLDLKILTEQAKVRDLLDLGQIALDISGELKGVFNITGNLDNLVTEGNVSITDGQFLGQSLDDAELQFRLDGKRFYFRRFSGLLNGSRVELSGFLNDTQMDLSYKLDDFQLQNLDMDMINDAGLKIAANIDLAGKIQGSPDDPIVSGTLVGEQVNINGTDFDSLKGEFLYNNYVLAFSYFDFLTNGGKYTIDGYLVFDETGDNIVGSFSDIDFKIKMNNVKTDEMVKLLIAENMDSSGLYSLTNITGRLSGHVEIHGPLQNLTGEVVLYSPELQYSDMSFENMFFSGALQSGVVAISSMRLLVGDGYIDLSGNIGLDGTIALHATGSKLPLSMIGKFMGLKYDSKGYIDMVVTVEDTVSKPMVTCSFEAGRGRIDKVNFDSVSGSIVFDDAGLYLSNIVGRQNGNVAEIVGFVPFDITDFKPQDTIGGLDIFIRMKEVDMELLTLLTNEFEWCQGKMDAFIHLVGSLATPVPNGYITFANGEVKLRNLKDPLTGINGTIVAEEGIVQLNRISGKLGQTGTLDIGGQIVLTGFGPQSFDINVTGSGVRILTYGFDGHIDGSARLTDAGEDFSITADLRLYNGSVLTTDLAAAEAVTMNPRLDVRLKVDKNISITGAGIDVPVSGQLYITGRLNNDVSVRGWLDADEGVISLFGIDFMLEEGKVEFYDLVGYIPAINARARTVAGGAIITMNVSGRADGLQISFTSDPPKTTDEILALLSWPGAISRVLRGEVGQVIQEQIVDYVDTQIQQTILRGLSNTVRNLLNLDEFTIETHMGRIVQIEMGKNLTDKIYLNYVREFDGFDVRDDFGIEVTLNSNFVFNGGVTSEGEVKIGVEAKFEF